MTDEINPLMPGTAALALASSHLAKQVEWGLITKEQAASVVQHAITVVTPTQQREAEAIYRTALPGLF